MSSGVSRGTGRVSFGRLVTFGAIAGMLAAVANGVVYLLAAAVGTMPDDVAVSGGAPITLLPVVLSFITPFTIPGAPAAMILTLLIMHVVAAAIIIWVLTTLAPRQS